MNEQFSAFLDNEATRDEADSVVNALLRDEQLRDSWARQHWLRTALRAPAGETPPPLDAGFSARVMQVIQAEPDLPAESALPAAGYVAAPRRHRRWRSMAGVAVAASATGFVLLVSNPLQQETTTGAAPARMATAAGTRGAQQPQVVASTTLNGDMIDATAMPVSAAAVSADHWAVSDPALENELNGYLVEHNGLARGYGLSATTPGFVRVATYGREASQ